MVLEVIPERGNLLFRAGNHLPLLPTCGTCRQSMVVHPTGSTYFARRGRWVKIGYTNLDPSVRIRSLNRRLTQVLIPYDMDPHDRQRLELVAVVHEDVEHWAHQWYVDEHVVGEWFTDDVIAPALAEIASVAA